MKVGIVVDTWKLSIFERRLTRAGYSYTNFGEMTEGVTTLTVVTDNPEALLAVTQAANTEAAQTGNVK